MSQQRLQYLLEKLLNSDCTEAEKQELFQLIETVNDEPQLQDVLEGAWQRYDQPTHIVSEDRLATILKNILNENQVVPLRSKRKLWPYMAAAASVVVLIGLAIYRLSLPATKAPAEPNTAAITNDVKAPDKSKATLTLAGGQQILLDQAQSGTLATENGSRVIMGKDGQLVYQSTIGNRQSAIVTYNTLNNPRGSRVVTLTLPDGTRVWVNAGTSLTYPTVFAANERKLVLTGEAYFEVTKDAAKPFRVQFVSAGREGSVEVLGTHFNVKAYDDEANAKVTLLEGSVKVAKQSAIGNRQSAKDAERAVVLKPGEQAVLAEAIADSRFTIAEADVAQVMAWKNGLFDYKRSDITEVLRDAARWYDIEVVYEGKKPADTFTGGIDRTATLTELLTILQMTGVRFKLEGRKLIVLNSK
jgi:ferric-dicitrate binding protein FerR (iron transport regulator)